MFDNWGWRVRAGFYGEIMTPKETLEQTPWAKLEHAYGEAVDTPEFLEVLLRPEEQVSAEDFEELEDHLYTAVLHQGTVYPATVPAYDFMTEALPTLDGTRRELALDWMCSVAEVMDYVSEDSVLSWMRELKLEDLYSMKREDHRDIPWLVSTWQLQQRANKTIDTLMELTGLDSDVLACVCKTLASCARCSGAKHQRERVSTYIWQRMEEADDDLKVQLSVCLGIMEEDLSEFLNHPNPALRAAAALGVKTPEGTAELVDALRKPDECRKWDFLSYFSTIDTIVEELIDRKTPPALMLDSVCVLIRESGGLGGTLTWGPIFQYCFHYDETSDSSLLNEDQRILAQAMVDNPRLWAENDGNCQFLRRDVGLPNTQEEVRELIKRSGASYPGEC